MPLAPDIIEIHDINARELDPYCRLTEAQLRNRLEPQLGVFIAESPKGILAYSLLGRRQAKKCSQSRERGMEHRKAGSILRMGNCMMPQVRSPVASMMKPPHPEKLSSRKGVVYCPTKPADKSTRHCTRN